MLSVKRRNVGYYIKVILCICIYLLTGFIIEQTGSMDVPYQVVGAAETFGGVLFFSILCLRNRYGVQYEALEEGPQRPIRRRYVSESFS